MANAISAEGSRTDRLLAAMLDVGKAVGRRYIVHGRNPAEGLDCVGYVLAVYKAIGLSIDRADLPYGARDQYRPGRMALMHKRLSIPLHRIGVDVPLDCQPGDVVLVCGGQLVHIGIAADGKLWEMTKRGVVRTSLSRVWPFTAGIYRHPALAAAK